MEYTKKDLASYNLHLIQTDRFKTITIQVVFHSPIIKEEITTRNILSDILLQSSKKYENRRSLTIQSEDLYAVDIMSNTQRVGNYIFTSFTMQSLNDNYTEEGNLSKAVEFLSEIIFNPDVNNDKFKKDNLEIVKNNANVAFDSLKENAGMYSLIKMLEAYDENSPVSYRTHGYKEDLDKIDTSNLYDYYKKMITDDLVDIFVVGDFSIKEMTAIIKKYFKFRKIKKRKNDYILDCKKCRSKKLIVNEQINNSQSKLSIAAPITDMTEYERNYPLVLGNIILGGSPESKLFREVREANSLCYTIRSIPNKLDNLLVITAGIDKDNYDKTVSLINDILKDMKKGKFSDNDINKAKEMYNASVEELEENEYRIINEYLFSDILGLEPLPERVKKMNKVTKHQIVRMCKKINIDTIFLLEGVKHEED